MKQQLGLHGSREQAQRASGCWHGSQRRRVWVGVGVDVQGLAGHVGQGRAIDVRDHHPTHRSTLHHNLGSRAAPQGRGRE
eukprot:3046116-Rhodomonas_salina.1